MCSSRFRSLPVAFERRGFLFGKYKSPRYDLGLREGRQTLLAIVVSEYGTETSQVLTPITVTIVASSFSI